MEPTNHIPLQFEQVQSLLTDAAGRACLLWG